MRRDPLDKVRMRYYKMSTETELDRVMGSLDPTAYED